MQQPETRFVEAATAMRDAAPCLDMPAKLSAMMREHGYLYFRGVLDPAAVQARIVETLGGYSHEVRRQVLERNAVELYNLPF